MSQGLERMRPTGGEASVTHAELTVDDQAALAAAWLGVQQSRGIIIRGADLLAGLVGSATAFGVRHLAIPPALASKARALGEAALRRASNLAILGQTTPPLRQREALPRLAAAVSGALGGYAGVSGFLPDVSLVTLLIMRRIAAVAREEGEDLALESARAACLEVFALGRGPGEAGEITEFGYWSARMLLQGRPLTLLLSEIAATYGLRLSQKFALQATPIVGAIAGAAVNSVFLDHYQRLARLHFTVRRLERTVGQQAVRRALAAFTMPSGSNSTLGRETGAFPP
jgi:EcsC protein family